VNAFRATALRFGGPDGGGPGAGREVPGVKVAISVGTREPKYLFIKARKRPVSPLGNLSSRGGRLDPSARPEA
jgi:hypothetical protein